jgi:hypothetical protein
VVRRPRLRAARPASRGPSETKRLTARRARRLAGECRWLSAVAGSNSRAGARMCFREGHES